MNYKVIRNAAGELVCFGEDNGMYEPTVKAGEVMSIEATQPLPSQRELNKTNNMRILALMAAADLRIIDALVYGHTGKLTAHRAAQDVLRAQLV